MIYSKTHINEQNYIEVAKNYYALRNEWKDMTSSDRHLALITCINEHRNNLIFTGQSACAIYGIPRLDAFEMRPHCIAQTSRCTEIICWRRRAYDKKAVIVNQLSVVNPSRAICDLANYDTSVSLLTSINHCLFTRQFTINQLFKELDISKAFRGKNKLKNILKYASSKCESPLETLAWVKIYNAGYVLPIQQKNIFDNQNFIGRVDMYWEIKDKKVILELDDMNKYEDITDLHSEKYREDKLRMLKYEIIRATWKNVINGEFIIMLEKVGIPKRRYRKKLILQ